MATTRKRYSPQFKARGGGGSDQGREDAQPVGMAVQGASHADREMAEGALEQLPELSLMGRKRKTTDGEADNTSENDSREILIQTLMNSAADS